MSKLETMAVSGTPKVTVSTAVKQQLVGGSVGSVSGSLWEEGLTRAWAKAIEILGPGTVTRDQVAAIVGAARSAEKQDG